MSAFEEESESEEPLAGGNVNGAIVRIGDTVRRATTAASPAIHGFLRHLEARGFTGSPRFLDIDPKGREVLSHLPGEVGFHPYLWEEDAALIATAKLLREYHDAAQGYIPPEGSRFAFYYPDFAQHEVICHNDFAPYNLVCDPVTHIPYGVIDFDMVGPGPRLRDIAYACYWLVPLAFGSGDLNERAHIDLKVGSRRLHLFCETYGVEATPKLLGMVDEVLQFLGDWLEEGVPLGDATRIRMITEGHLTHWRQERDAFQKERSRIETNLSAE